MKLKKAKTIEEQINILESRGLVIKDRDFAATVLRDINYYVLSGYLHEFKDKAGNYKEGLPFEHISALYKFDSALRNILLYAMEHVEQGLKTRIAYTIALAYPDSPCIYESSDLFKNKVAHDTFMGFFKNTVRNNANIPFVKHHLEVYDGHFPIWVAVELFTMGNLRHLYQNLPNGLRRQISRTFDVSPEILDSWLENLRITRNSLAHNMKLYGTVMRLTPKLPERYYNEKIIRHRIFDQIRLLMILYPDPTIWSRIMADIEETLNNHVQVVELDKIGFPDNWKAYLQKKE